MLLIIWICTGAFSGKNANAWSLLKRLLGRAYLMLYHLKEFLLENYWWCCFQLYLHKNELIASLVCLHIKISWFPAAFLLHLFSHYIFGQIKNFNFPSYWYHKTVLFPGIVPTSTIMLDVYLKEMDGDSEWVTQFTTVYLFTCLVL